MFIAATHCSLQQRVKRVRVEWYAQGRPRMEAWRGHFPLCPFERGATGAEVPFHHWFSSRQIFGRGEGSFPNFSQTCPKSFLCNFFLQSFSHKHYFDLFLVWPPKKVFMCFLQTLGAIFWNQATFGGIVGTAVVGYCTVEIPTGWRVNLVVAGAQVGLPTKQPDVLKLPSTSKPNQKAFTTLSANNSPVVL